MNFDDEECRRTASLVERCRLDAGRLEAQVALAQDTRKAILAAITPYAAVLGSDPAAHMLMDCAIQVVRWTPKQGSLGTFDEP